MSINITEKISALLEAGMTQVSIEDKTKVPQYRISRIATGVTKRPSWEDVHAINQLYIHVIQNSKHWNDFKLKTTEEA